MITIYSHIEGINQPKWNATQGWEEYSKQENKYVDDVKQFCKANSKHKLAGEEVLFPVADGYARYVVFTPTKLIHLAVDDAWEYPHIERLLGKDISENINRRKALRELFASKS